MDDPIPPPLVALLVEDETTLRLVTTRFLQSMGFTVHPAASSAAALLTFDALEQRIDLLVTDLALPVMNGAELADHVQQHCPSSRVLFITGWATGSGRDSGALVGGRPILGKPFTRQTLEAAVRAALA